MLIDWFTVRAQALNFVILVWLLKHFLYQPILNAIEAREQGIASKLAGADAKQKDAQKEQDDFQSKNKAFDQQRAALLSKATDEVKAEHDRLLGDAHKEAASLRAGQATALRNDQARLCQEITRTASDEVFAIARRTLADLASASLEERVGAVFTRRLGEMDAKAKLTLGAALKTSPSAAIVRSAFDMPNGQRATIQNAVNETFSADIPLEFRTDHDTICGIELTANGQKIGWSIADYLTALDQKVGALLGPQAKAAQPEPATK